MKLPDAEEEIISMEHKKVKKLKIHYGSQEKTTLSESERETICFL